jgi:hypothetical protein
MTPTALKQIYLIQGSPGYTGLSRRLSDEEFLPARPTVAGNKPFKNREINIPPLKSL